MLNPLLLPKKVYDYITTLVTPFDILASGVRRGSGGKIRVGWCSVFPPAPNGVAAANYFLLKKLLKRKDIELYAIPFGGRIDKKLFPAIRYARSDSDFLDVIVFFGLGNNLKWIIERARCRKIVWQTLHDPLSSGGMLNDHAELKMLESLRKADLVLTMSKWSLNEYKRHGLKKAGYMPHAVETSMFTRRAKTKGNFTVLYVSRINYYKGVMPFLDTIPLVLKRNHDVVFKLHGPIDHNSPCLDEIKSAIKKTEQSYPQNFFVSAKWVGFGKIDEVYDGVDVLLFPSSSEGFGIPLIEAMSKGIPCIVADKPPMNEVVIDGETGFCIKYRKGMEKKYHGYRFPCPEDMAEKIISLIENRKLLDSMGKKCREHVKENYEMQPWVDCLAGHIKNVAGKSRR